MAIPTTEFKVKQTIIPGLLEIEVSKISDSRGWFQEKYQKAKLVAAGFPADFEVVQHSLSYNIEKGVVRGFHAEPWDKYISVVAGKIFAVYVDLRKENFGKKVELTIDNTKAVFVPRGVANSFQTLEENTYYTYLVNDHWSEVNMSKYKFINLSDKDLAVDWPIPLGQSIISDRDKTHPNLSAVTPF